MQNGGINCYTTAYRKGTWRVLKNILLRHIWISFSPTFTYLVNSSSIPHVSFSSRLRDTGGNFLLAGAWNAFVDMAWNWLKTPIKPVTWCFSLIYRAFTCAYACPVSFHSKRITAGGSGHIEDCVSSSDKSCLEIDRVSVINNSRLGLTNGRPESDAVSSLSPGIRFFTTEFLMLVETLAQCQSRYKFLSRVLSSRIRTRERNIEDIYIRWAYTIW